MSRPPRIEFPGACYHVTGRAPTGRKSFKDRTDYRAFLNVLDSVAARFGWLIHSYALLENHYHVVVEVPHSNLSRGMRQLNGVYTQHYNRRHLGEGPVFRGRFKSIVFEKDLYLLAICRHVLLNPLRISGQASLEKYRFSSYLAMIGEVSSPDFLHRDTVLQSFSTDLEKAEARWKKFVADGQQADSPLAGRSNQVLLGSEQFVDRLQTLMKNSRKAKQAPKRQNRRKSLRVLFRHVANQSKTKRNALIKQAHLQYDYTLIEIGSFLGLHYTTVSKVVNADHQKLGKI